MSGQNRFSGGGRINQSQMLIGKYRGKVVSNKDPDGKGRLQVSVPSILDEANSNSWAEPCVPYAGDGVGFYSMPPEGANVWVEFRGGSPAHPIWVGCFWGDEDEVPSDVAKEERPNIKVWKTDKAIIRIDDDAGEILIQVNEKQTILMKDGEITIDNGQNSVVVLDGAKKVTINEDGLEVR